MTQEIIDSLIAKYNADIIIARTNLNNYFKNSVGVGEHPDIVSEADKLIDAIATAEGKVESLRKVVESFRKAQNESSNNRK